MTSQELTYCETDREVAETYDCALAYVIEGDILDAPYNLRGLGVYAVISMLRQNDDRFYGDEAVLDEGAQQRLAEVVAEVDKAVKSNMQYYPFGHNRSLTSQTGDIDDRRRSVASRGGFAPMSGKRYPFFNSK